MIDFLGTPKRLVTGYELLMDYGADNLSRRYHVTVLFSVNMASGDETREEVDIFVFPPSNIAKFE